MKTELFLLQTIIILTLSNSLQAKDIVEHGKSIFVTRCTGCHKIGNVFTGPDLTGVDKRRSVDWVIHFVQSSQAVIKGGDKDATALFEKFNKIQMPDHKDLNESDIKDIVAYVNAESILVGKNTAPFKTPLQVKPGYKPISAHNYAFILIYLALVALLVLVLYIAVHVSTITINKEPAVSNVVIDDTKAA